jgi:hypothetical protein
MDAMQRYRHRLRLQRAIARVIQLFRDFPRDIAPDRRTAHLGAQAIRWLVRFAHGAGLSTEETLLAPPDPNRFNKLVRDRQKETAARKARWERQAARPKKKQPRK